MLSNDEVVRHAAQHQKYEQASRAKPNTVINPANREQVEDLILDIEGWGDFQYPGNRQPAANYLRGFGFSEEAIDSILQDVTHEVRVELAFLEAARIQQQRMTDGVVDLPRPSDAYEVKTVILGNPAQMPLVEADADARDAVCDHPLPESGVNLVQSEVHDDQYEEIRFSAAGLVAIAPSSVADPTALSPSVEAVAPPGVGTKPRVRRKSPLPDDVVAVVNAHYPSDRSATIRQTRLVRWIANIKELPMYSAFDVFGELNGELVDLTMFVNRVGQSCYVGNAYARSGGKCSVAWDTSLLGPLPKKGEKFHLRIISINPRVEAKP